MASDGAACCRQPHGSAFDTSCHVARLRFKPRYLAIVAVVLATTLAAPVSNPLGAVIEAPAVVVLQSRPFSYRLPGEFTHGGKPLIAPQRIVQLDQTLTIMIHQVTVVDYERCARDHACQRVAPGIDMADRPVVKISWQDANAYAAWLSRQLGATYRLPTDEEWVFAAGSRFKDDGLPDGAVEPGQRLLRQYELETDRDDALDAAPRAIGSFGANENGIFDFAGNVWEWTDTCFVHHASNATGGEASIANCGVRVVDGRHRTYMSDFIRDPRTGGCAVGKPPLNLGFRLVRELP
jgi:formylglycine-generating enzyme required for sulfatase activity